LAQAAQMLTTASVKERRKAIRLNWLRSIRADVERAQSVEDLREAITDLVDWLIEGEEEAANAG